MPLLKITPPKLCPNCGVLHETDENLKEFLGLKYDYYWFNCNCGGTLLIPRENLFPYNPKPK